MYHAGCACVLILSHLPLLPPACCVYLYLRKQNIGCDGCLGSNAKNDVCRVCGGDGSSCTLSSNIFQKTLTQFGEYKHKYINTYIHILIYFKLFTLAPAVYSSNH